MSTDWFGEFDPELLAIDPLLLRSASGEVVNGTTFLRNLLAVVAGRRSWLEVTREYLSRAEFEAALRCMERAPGACDELLAAIRESWQIWRRRCQEQLSALNAKHEVLRGLRGPEAAAGDAAELLNDAKALLSSMPEEVFDDRTSALALLQHAPLRIAELPTYLALAEVGLEEESKAIADRERRIRDRLLELKKGADALIGELLLRDAISAMEERSVNVQQARLNEAIRGKNIVLLEHVISSLEKIKRGEVSVEDALPVSPASTSILMEPVPFRREDLSSAATQLLRQTVPKIPVSAPGKDFTAFNPWEWDAVRLERQKAVKIIESNATGNPAEAEKALGEVLMAEAKLRLLDRDAFRARILFCDAFRWSCQFPSERAQRDVIVSCILLTSAIMFLPTAERPSVESGSLAKEIQRRVDTHLVARLDQRELLHEQGAVLVRLGAGSARVYFQNYLRGYLAEHARAANSLLVELVDLADELPGVALSVLCLVLTSLLGELPPSANAKLEEATEAAKALGAKDRTNADQVLRLIRSALLTLIDDNDLAAVVHEALEALAKKLTQPMQSPKSLRQSLITDEVTENANDPRVVVRVTEPGDARIRYLRSVLYFFDRHGERVKLELDDPPLMTILPEGESCEIDFYLKSVEPELLSRIKTIQVRHVYLDDKGAAQGLQTDHERFSIRFRNVSPTTPPTPYIVGNAVQDVAGIYGRDDDIEMIWDALTGAKQDNVVLVRGPRRIGKTTLLNALVEHPRFIERYIITREDLQVKNASDSAIVFRSKLPPVIQARLQQAGIVPPRIRDERFNESPEQGFKEFMLEVDEAVQLAGRRLLIILDELDQLAENPTFGPTAVATLREVIIATRRTSFILAGAREVLDRLTLTREDRLFKLGLEVALAPLPADAARSLIQKPARPWYTMSERAVDLIVRETNRQPYLIQCVCHEVFQHATREGLGRVTESYVAEVLMREIIPRERFFVEFKSVAQNDDDYRLLKAIALRQWGNAYVAITELGRDLGMGGESGRRTLRERLQALLSQAPEVVERHGVDRQRYRLKVGLFARHLRYLQEDGRLTG